MVILSTTSLCEWFSKRKFTSVKINKIITEFDYSENEPFRVSIERSKSCGTYIHRKIFASTSGVLGGLLSEGLYLILSSSEKNGVQFLP